MLEICTCAELNVLQYPNRRGYRRGKAANDNRVLDALGLSDLRPLDLATPSRRTQCLPKRSKAQD